MGLPGVKVGPMDPDATETFGQVNATTARRLLRLHERANPPELRRALAMKMDEPRTTAVLRNLPEIAEYLSGLELENGDPVVPEGAKVAGANVRGEPGTDQVLTYTYVVPSGRSAKWFVPYDGDAIPDAHEMGTELTRIARAREVGVVAWDDQGHSKQALDRENAHLRRQVAALRKSIEGGEDVEVPADSEASAGAVADGPLLEELQELRVRDQENQTRLAQLEAALAALPGGGDVAAAAAGGQPAVDHTEPWEDYDSTNARDVADRLKAEGADPAEAERVLAYERSHANRQTVVAAAERALDQARK